MLALRPKRPRLRVRLATGSYAQKGVVWPEPNRRVLAVLAYLQR